VFFTILKILMMSKEGELNVWWKGLKSSTKVLLIISGLYYKNVMIVNYASSGVNKLRALLNDDARVVIYDHHMFIVQATDC
jgi:hypothetical protein